MNTNLSNILIIFGMHYILNIFRHYTTERPLYSTTYYPIHDSWGSGSGHYNSWGSGSGHHDSLGSGSGQHNSWGSSNSGHNGWEGLLFGRPEDWDSEYNPPHNPSHHRYWVVLKVVIFFLNY